MVRSSLEQLPGIVGCIRERRRDRESRNHERVSSRLHAPSALARVSDTILFRRPKRTHSLWMTSALLYWVRAICPCVLDTLSRHSRASYVTTLVNSRKTLELWSASRSIRQKLAPSAFSASAK